MAALFLANVSRDCLKVAEGVSESPWGYGNLLLMTIYIARKEIQYALGVVPESESGVTQ